MKKQEKARFIQETLGKFHPNPPIPLNHSNSYTLLIAVLLSAQCTDARVNMITPSFFERANTPQKMATVPVNEIEDIIRTCGLAPKKAKAIRNLSQILLDKHKGEVPQTFEELEALPGVGHKTASVVMSQAFHQLAFPVDTHIHRAAKRWGLSNGKSVEQTEKDLKRIFPKESWNQLHLQIIYFCREHCPAKKHNADTCPICSKL